MSVSVSTMRQANEIISEFQHCYALLNRENIDSGWLDNIYDPNMVFQDCFHHIEGLDHFKRYCSGLYASVLHTRFEFHDQWVKEGSAVLTWTLCYAHPQLLGGQTITVPGSTVIHFHEKITHHQDYFDGGAMLYEHLPLLGTAVRFFKKRLDS